MSLPENIKLPSYVKNRTTLGISMILPAIYGIFKVISGLLYGAANKEQITIGAIIFIVSVVVMMLFTECHRLIIKPTVFIQRDDVRVKLYVVHAYPKRHWERYTSEDIEWIEVIKLFPWVYVSVGEPFKGSDSPFIRRHKDFM